MKKTLLASLGLLLCALGAAQIHVSVNTELESTIDYQRNRLSFGVTFNPNQHGLSMIMPVFKYDFIENEDHNIYIGCTLSDLDNITSVRIPLGINYYPFEKKQFGLLMEVFGSYGTDYDYYQPTGYKDRLFVRGSVGFIYRFKS